MEHVTFPFLTKVDAGCCSGQCRAPTLLHEGKPFERSNNSDTENTQAFFTSMAEQSNRESKRRQVQTQCAGSTFKVELNPPI